MPDKEKVVLTKEAIEEMVKSGKATKEDLLIWLSDAENELETSMRRLNRALKGIKNVTGVLPAPAEEFMDTHFLKEKTYKNFPGGLKISKEYSELIPPTSKDDYNQLFVNIATDGYIRDSLVVDQDGVILDGHSRYKIAEILDMTFTTVVKKIDNITEGKLWIIDNTLGRRGEEKKTTLR